MNWTGPKGVCRSCGGTYQLKLDGTLRGHVPGDKPGSYLTPNPMDWCPGSWNKPKEA